MAQAYGSSMSGPDASDVPLEGRALARERPRSVSNALRIDSGLDVLRHPAHRHRSPAGMHGSVRDCSHQAVEAHIVARPCEDLEPVAQPRMIVPL